MKIDPSEMARYVRYRFSRDFLALKRVGATVSLLAFYSYVFVVNNSSIVHQSS